jgi:phosphoribosylformylglycinamidine cyclo-ligase
MIKGMAHITGGGLLENVPRVLPENTVAETREGRLAAAEAVRLDAEAEGNVDEKEMHRTFNCGIGLVIVVAAADADAGAWRSCKAQWRKPSIASAGSGRVQGDEAQTLVV